MIITNVYPSETVNTTPIVKNMVEHYRKEFPMDDIEVVVVSFKNIVNNLWSTRKKIINDNVEIVHAHFGGWHSFLASLFFVGLKCKTVITYHGTDIHGNAGKKATLKRKYFVKINTLFSYLTLLMYDELHFISNELKTHIPILLIKYIKNKITIISLSVDYDIFKLKSTEESKRYLKLGDKNFILFINNNNSEIKREAYARKLVDNLGIDYEILKLHNVEYNLIPYYFNASCAIIITSESEGSPNIVREALATNLPIISVDVGDIKEYVSKCKNSFIINKYDIDVATKEILSNLKLLSNKENTRDFFEQKISYEYNIKKIKRLYTKT